MVNGKNVLAVIPARGGSKGVKLKNIQPILGIPLIGYVGNLVKEIPLIDRAIVSTDNEEIAKVASSFGLDVPFFRPQQLSGDRIGDWDVLFHALNEIEKIDNKIYDYIVMLQPTSPLRLPIHVIESISKLDNDKLDSVWTVNSVDLKYHPFKQLTIENDNLELYDERGRQIIARQQLTPTYYRNGACYAFTRDCINEQKTILGKKTGAIILQDTLVSIDTLDDFKKVEEVLLTRKIIKMQ